MLLCVGAQKHDWTQKEVKARKIPIVRHGALHPPPQHIFSTASWRRSFAHPNMNVLIFSSIFAFFSKSRIFNQPHPPLFFSVWTLWSQFFTQAYIYTFSGGINVPTKWLIPTYLPTHPASPSPQPWSATHLPLLTAQLTLPY